MKGDSRMRFAHVLFKIRQKERMRKTYEYLAYLGILILGILCTFVYFSFIELIDASLK